MEAAGYLRQVEEYLAISGPRWVTTVQGDALAQASFGKPITRATADRHLAQVIERTRSYHANPAYLLTIAQIAVFDLDPDADRLGDLDLAVTAVRRETEDSGTWIVCSPTPERAAAASGSSSRSSCGGMRTPDDPEEPLARDQHHE